jgi:excisionase family DNA binding protein
VEENAEDKLLSVREAAQKCNRNAETVRRWIWSGKLPAEKLGNQLYIKKKALESYCREIAVIPYQANRGERMNSIKGNLHGTSIKLPPGSRSDLIEKMRNLRERIRARIGRDFTEDEIVGAIHKIREERDNEISGLR